LVESCLPYAIASYGIERGYIGSGDCSDGTEPVVKIVGAVCGDRVGLSRNAVTVNGWKLANSGLIFAIVAGAKCTGSHSIGTDLALERSVGFASPIVFAIG
jgi:hypothetical protein